MSSPEVSSSRGVRQFLFDLVVRKLIRHSRVFRFNGIFKSQNFGVGVYSHMLIYYM